MADVVMPRLSDTMEEGTILHWLIADGEPVRRGDELVEIETDKATMTYESDLDGILAIVAAEGDTLPVGAIIARVGAAIATNETETDGAGAENADATPSREHGAEVDDDEADTTPNPPPTSGAESLREAAPPATEASIEGADGERVKASPLARRIARDTGVDLHTIAGTGPGGRIVKADVQAAAEHQPDSGGRRPASRAALSPPGLGAARPPAAGAAPAPPAGAAPAPPAGATPPPPDVGLAGVATAKGETTEVELSRAQQTIARRMAESKATIPHFALQADVDMSECVTLRSELGRLTPGDPAAETIPTYNDMVVKACALALREHPRANSSYRDGRLQLHSRVNVGVAVAVDSEKLSGSALIVPTVFDADVKSLGEIARETRTLAARVRDGSITPPELGGGTFTVSNLGMFGVSAFTAIINPPQAAILSVGSLAPRPVVRAGDADDASDGGEEIVARPTMTVTLACDHRILYGADAARFLARIRGLLEAPAALTL
jgi:pyruvate dehydrogenase E2 component (dihydrolipoamide acetyltransferase)